MKSTAILLTTLGLLLGSLQAQVNVPAFLNYQGKVTDSTGAGLGTGTPVNRKVVFRIWDTASSGTAPLSAPNTSVNRLWTEEQTVTISNGEFSVLLGNGIAATGGIAGESRPAFETVFNGTLSQATADRYLELIVDDGNNAINASDLPITPRQRLTTNAYSFRARTADGVPLHRDLQFAPSRSAPNPEIATSDNGLGWYGTERKFNGISVGGPVLYGEEGGALGSANGGTQNIALQWNASGSITNNVNFTGTITGNVTGNVTGSGASLTSLNASNITTGTLSSARLSSLDAAQTTTGIFAVAQIPSLDASKINSGTFASARIPVLTAAHIPSLDASKITTGTWASARLATNVMLRDSVAQQALGFGLHITGPNPHNGPTPGNLFPHLQGAWLEWNKENGGGKTYLLNNRGGGPGGIVFGTVDDANNHTQHMLIDAGGNVTMSSNAIINGRVGIGTTNPTKAKVEISGNVSVDNGAYAYYSRDAFTGNPSTGGSAAATQPFSLWASDRIGCTEFNAFSDKRIKTITGTSDGSTDLLTLLGLHVTNYTFKDKIAKGCAPQKKLIAQQVEQVFPQAVSRTTDVVPDIYQKATVKDGWVALRTTLKKGERVRLIADKNEGIYEAIEVDADGGRFRTAFTPKGSDLFVYGREVNDFRSVDYDAIAMLNVSATQQIKKEKDAEVKALQNENAALRTELKAQRKALDAQAVRFTALEAKDKARDAKLAAIEKALLSADEPTARPVSLRQTAGAE